MVDLIVETPLAGRGEHPVTDSADEPFPRLLRVRRGEVRLEGLPRGELLATHVAGEGEPPTLAAPVLTYVRLQALLGLELGGTVGALVGHGLRRRRGGGGRG